MFILLIVMYDRKFVHYIHMFVFPCFLSRAEEGWDRAGRGIKKLLKLKKELNKMLCCFAICIYK